MVTRPPLFGVGIDHARRDLQIASREIKRP
jgi:hypothetical protein